MEKFYRRQSVEYFVAMLIVLNFLINIWEKQVDPTGFGSDPNKRLYARRWNILSDLFNIAFLIELIINMYAFWLWDFWKDAWNVFDFVVVVIGVLSLARVELGAAKLLRLMRAFRVMRLFKRVKSLNKIIVSLGKAVPGMANAMVIQVIFMSIFAMVGVEFFSNAFMPPGSMQGQVNWDEIASCPRWDDEGIHMGISRWYYDHRNGTDHPEHMHRILRGSGDKQTTGYGSYHQPEEEFQPDFHKYAYASADYKSGQECYITARGQRYAYEYYGTFFRSLYTLFQVLTGDSWSEAIARPMLERMGGLTSIFYVLYVIINVVVLVNVVVAVLLEKMVDDGSGDDEDDTQPFKHKDHEYANHDAKATTGEMFDFRNEMVIKHAILQAQVDALTKNIEALCKAQNVPTCKPTKANIDYAELFNERGEKMFDETTGKRLTSDTDGKPVTKCWFPVEELPAADFSLPAGHDEGKAGAGNWVVGSKVVPDINGDNGESYANSKQPEQGEEGC